MKTKALLLTSVVSISLLAASNVKAAEPFTKTDWAMQGVVVATILADTSQTLQIKNHPNLYETNPILGKHPSDTRIVTYAIGGIVSSYLGARMLHGPWRTMLQVSIISMEGSAIHNNLGLGLSVHF